MSGSGGAAGRRIPLHRGLSRHDCVRRPPVQKRLGWHPAHYLPVSLRREKLEAWVRRDLTDRFRERLLAIDGTVAATWGRLAGEAESRGEPVPVIDGLIAPTSLAHDLIVATRNGDDFERCGARCFNPWLKGVPQGDTGLRP